MVRHPTRWRADDRGRPWYQPHVQVAHGGAHEWECQDARVAGWFQDSRNFKDSFIMSHSHTRLWKMIQAESGGIPTGSAHGNQVVLSKRTPGTYQWRQQGGRRFPEQLWWQVGRGFEDSEWSREPWLPSCCNCWCQIMPESQGVSSLDIVFPLKMVIFHRFSSFLRTASDRGSTQKSRWPDHFYRLRSLTKTPLRKHYLSCPLPHVAHLVISWRRLLSQIQIPKYPKLSKTYDFNQF